MDSHTTGLRKRAARADLDLRDHYIAEAHRLRAETINKLARRAMARLRELLAGGPHDNMRGSGRAAHGSA